MNTIKIVTLLFLIGVQHSVTAQLINGNIYDQITKEPLVGTTIYLDGTTIGTMTDMNGHFELELKGALNSSLIVSHIGYSTKIFSLSKYISPKDIYLLESANQLEEVVIEPDNWSREKKLRIFKQEFLGYTESTKYCSIINEKDITIIYRASSNTLIAYSDKPIIILNKYLGYQITYNLVDFEIEFRHDIMGLRYPHKVYYSGTSFFSELKKKVKKKHLLNRKNIFNGSLIHFMRSLANYELTENKFGIYYESLPVNPYKHFKITKKDSQTKIEITVEKLSVLYNQFDQSAIEFSKGFNEFYIDRYGNHSPTNSLIFGGDFAIKRISSMLPLNYSPIKN